MKWILCWGNPADGYEFVGPFNSQEAAVSYAETDREIRNAAWHVILLQRPAP